MKRRTLPSSLTILAAMDVILAAMGSRAAAVEVEAKEIHVFEWRNIGPFNVGRGA